jgi:Holliday junction resolvase RusA-like endonuclease
MNAASFAHAQNKPQASEDPAVAPVIAFTILGEPASKANSRKIVTIAGRPSSIKSDKALDYERYALMQIPVFARRQLAGPVSVTMRIFYATERPDLDETLILDILQDRFKTVKRGGTKVRELVQKGVYRNDRQVREKHIYHAIDRNNPRTLVEVRLLAPELFA